MGFEFGGIEVSTPKKNIEKINNNILLGSSHRGNDKHVLFLVNTPSVPTRLVSVLKNWINVNLLGYDFDIVSASNIDASNEDIKKSSIYLFFIKNRSEFKKYIIPNKTVIVTFGYALQGVTLSSDLSVDCFYDFVFNKTYFYSPDTSTFVFPCDDLFEIFKFTGSGWMPKDSSRSLFARHQLEFIKSHYADLKDGLDEDRCVINRLVTKNDFKDLMKRYLGVRAYCAWDIETTGLSYVRNKIGCVTMSLDGKTGWFIPWRLVDTDLLSDFFEDKYQIGQNLKFDIKFMRQNGVRNTRINSDTLQLGHTLNEMRFNGLKSLAYYYTCHGGYDRKLDEFIRINKPENYMMIPENILSQYATMDAIVTYKAHFEMYKQMKAIDEMYPPIHENGWSIQDFYEKMKIPTANAFINIERRGMYVDMDKWDRNSDYIDDKIIGLKQELSKRLFLTNRFGLSDTSFDDLFLEEVEDDTGKELQSSQKLGIILKELGWENLGLNKKGGYLTGDEQLERWKKLGHEEAGVIQTLRSALVMQKTFMGKRDSTQGWRAYVDSNSEGKKVIHPSYKPMLNETHRNACGDPNYQQGVSQGDDAKLFKQIYSVPDKSKYYLVTLDKASFQLRLAALDSKDPVLFPAYIANPDVDMHLKTAYNCFIQGTEFMVDEITLSDGVTTKKYFANEEVKVKREGAVVKVKASAVVETDEFA